MKYFIDLLSLYWPLNEIILTQKIFKYCSNKNIWSVFKGTKILYWEKWKGEEFLSILDKKLMFFEKEESFI